MANNLIIYRVGFLADTSLLKTALNELSKLVTSLNSKSFSKGLDSDMLAAAASAAELHTHLSNAVNLNTGKLDLSKFLASLKLGNKSLQEYANNLGTVKEGREAFMSVATAITQAERPIFRVNAALDKMWTTMKNTMRWLLSSSILMGFTSALSTAYNYALDLDKSLNNIRIVTGQSAEEMAKFSLYANDAAKRLSTTTTAYTDAALIYYQLGEI